MHTQQRLETGLQSGLHFLPVLSPSSFPFSLLIPLLFSLSPLSVKTVYQISSENFLLADLVFMKDPLILGIWEEEPTILCS